MNFQNNYLRNEKVAKNLCNRIAEISKLIPSPKIRIMHVCGTHEDTVSKYGIRGILPDKIEIIPGPGCPVCVTTMKEIDEAILLAQKCVITTFGDLLKVPGSDGRSLASVKAEGGDVRIVYSIFDSIEIAKNCDREVVHIAVGFETSAPITASALMGRELPPNFSILSCHRLVPPALDVLMDDREAKIDGLIDPGHVSTVIGLRPYEPLTKKYGIPQVIAGFEPNDLLLGIVMLLEMIAEGRIEVGNEYSRVVKYEGNLKAQKVMEEVFEPFDVAWRGFPVISGSGLKLKEKFKKFDARVRFDLTSKGKYDSSLEEAKGCICGLVLRGRAYPDECALFGKKCTPEHPVGACMVSSEGSCGIWYRYGKF